MFLQLSLGSSLPDLSGIRARLCDDDKLIFVLPFRDRLIDSFTALPFLADILLSHVLWPDHPPMVAKTYFTTTFFQPFRENLDTTSENETLLSFVFSEIQFETCNVPGIAPYYQSY
jgi:hypothetical protein